MRRLLRHLPYLALVATMAGCVPRPLVEPVVATITDDPAVPSAQIAAGDALYPVRGGGGVGYVDRAGEVVIAPRFEAGAPFSEGLARVMAGGLWGYVRPDGSYAVEPRFADAADFSGGRARVVLTEARTDIQSRQARAEDRRFVTYITPAGRPIVESDLSEARDFAEVDGRPLAPVERTTVLRLVPFGIDALAFLSPALQVRREWVVLEAAGRVVFEVPQARRIQVYSEGLAAFEERPGLVPRPARWGYVDGSGSVAVVPMFESATPFSEGLAAVTSRGRIGYADRQGEWVIQPRFEEAGPFREGRARVRVDGRWGFIDPSGAYAIEPTYDVASNFGEGLAMVGRDGRYGFVRSDGTVALPLALEMARPFRNGLAYVRQDGREGYITPDGNFVWSRPSE
jgi:hypothetical protein